MLRAVYLFTLLAMLSLGRQAGAQATCSSPYVFNGSFPQSVEFVDLEKFGALLYIADAGRDEIQVLDVSDLSSPQQLLSYQDFVGLADIEDIELDWPLMFVADSRRGMVVLDFENLFSIQERGAVDLEFGAQSIAVGGANAFVAHTREGLIQLSILDPMNPVVVNTYGESDQVCITVDTDQSVVIAGYESGLLEIYEIVESGGLELCASINTNQPVTAAKVVEDNLYIGTSSSGFLDLHRFVYHYDITDPRNPFQVSFFTSLSDHIDIDLHSEGLCVSAVPAGRIILNEDMTLEGELSFRGGGQIQSTLVENQMALSVSQHGAKLSVVDLDQLNSPVLGSFHELSVYGLDHVRDHESSLYFLADHQGILAVDVLQDGALVEAGLVNTVVNTSLDVFEVYDGVLLHGHESPFGDDVLDVYDVSSGGLPQLRSSITLPSRAIAVVEKDGYLLVATDGVLYLQMIDITDLDAPVKLEPTWTGLAVRDLEIIEERLYVSGHLGVLARFAVGELPDIMHQGDQFFISAHSVSNDRGKVVVRAIVDSIQGERLYTSEIASDGELLLLDSEPVANANSVLLFQHDYLVTGNFATRLDFFHVNSADSIVATSGLQLPISSSTQGVAIVGDTLYVPGDSYMYAYNLSHLCGFRSCLPDLNDDGLLNFFDVASFIAAYTAQDSDVDFNTDGELNFFDVSAFLVAYSDGCELF